MATRDIYHYQLKHALEKDGWIITHDPFRLKIGQKKLEVDLAAERVIEAEKGLRKILVEVKSFVGRSDVSDLQEALGKYLMYLRVLPTTSAADHVLYLAVRTSTFHTVFETELGQLFLDDHFLRLIVFDEDLEVITAWIPD